MSSIARILALGVIFVSAAPTGAAAQSSDGTATASVLDGVYSKTQAARGKTTFQTTCAECHTSGQFNGAAFRRTWAGRAVHDLFELIRTTMPNTNPGGLSRQEYASVVAYFLEMNGYPAGDKELPTDEAGLKRIRLEQRDGSP